MTEILFTYEQRSIFLERSQDLGRSGGHNIPPISSILNMALLSIALRVAHMAVQRYAQRSEANRIGGHHTQTGSIKSMHPARQTVDEARSWVESMDISRLR